MKRESRYIVFKKTDVAAALTPQEQVEIQRLQEKLAEHRKAVGKKPFECVVIEQD